MAGFSAPHPPGRQSSDAPRTLLVPNPWSARRGWPTCGVRRGAMFEWAKAAGSVYQNHLQRILAERLGVAWGPDRNNTREMEGFSGPNCGRSPSGALRSRQNSRRSVPSMSRRRCAWRDDEASLATRTAKDHSLTPTFPRPAGGAKPHGRSCDGNGPGAERVPASAALCASGLGGETTLLVDREVALCTHSARFTKADVIKHLCDLRRTLEEITATADRFLNSELAVRLTPDSDPGPAGRMAAQWSTAAHRAMEDRTLALMDTLAARSAHPVGDASVEQVLAAKPGLGEDQKAAVRCSPVREKVCGRCLPLPATGRRHRHPRPPRREHPHRHHRRRHLPRLHTAPIPTWISSETLRRAAPSPSPRHRTAFTIQSAPHQRHRKRTDRYLRPYRCGCATCRTSRNSRPRSHSRLRAPWRAGLVDLLGRIWCGLPAR